MNLRSLKLAAGLLLLGVGVPAFGQGLGMLQQLEKGSWELRVRGESTPARRLCLRDGQELIQLQHPANQCARHVVEDAAGLVTVQYTCRGAGYGRTTIRRESPRLVQVDSQGIADGLPFAFAAEARRVGACGE